MAEEGKRIVFTGVDQTSQAANTAKRNLTDLHDTNIRKTRESVSEMQKLHLSLKETIDLLEKYKRTIESIASKGLSPAQAGIAHQLTGKLFENMGRVNPEHIKSYSQTMGQLGLTQDPKGLNETIVKKLQELIDTTKAQHKETFEHHKQDDDKQKPGGTAYNSLLSSFDAKAKAHKSSSEFTPEEIEAKRYQKEQSQIVKDLVLGKEGGGEKREGENLLSGFIDSLKETIANPIESGSEKLSKMGTLGGIAASAVALTSAYYEMHQKPLAQAKAAADDAQTYKFATEHIIPEIEEGPLGQNLAARERSYREQQRLQAQQIKYRALTGGISTIGDMSQFGLSSIEANEKAAEIAANLGRQATNADVRSSLLTGALGINAGGLERLGRFSGKEQSPDAIAASMIETLGMSKDRTKAPEWANELIKIGEQHLQVLGSINTKQTLSTMAALQSVGTPLFQNAETQSQIFSALDQGISKPSNQFAKASTFAAISKVMPGASFWEIQEAQEQGLSGQYGGQILDQTIQDLMAQFGGNKEQVKQAMLSRFPGLSHVAIDQLMEKYTPGMFSKNMTLAGAKQLMSLRGQSYANLSSQQKAQIESAFAQSPEAGLAMVDKLTGEGPAKASSGTNEAKARAASESNSSAAFQQALQNSAMNQFFATHGQSLPVHIIKDESGDKFVNKNWRQSLSTPVNVKSTIKPQ